MSDHATPDFERADAPVFVFRTSSVRPAATVTCKHCGWTAKGNDARVVFPQADTHECPRTGREDTR